MKLLIVEDDEHGRENLNDILEMDGHEIIGVATGHEALQTCRTREFDSLILDWKLPDLSADELIPQLQQIQPDKPIIVVTGYGDVEMVVSAMRNGVYDYLEKPINPSVLCATLARVAERQENIQQLDRVQSQLLSSERLAAIGQMVAGLAHESRNAFQRSQACLEMLELNLEGDSENLQILSKIQKALEELQRLYEEVREYASPIVLARDTVNVVSLVNECWRQIKMLRPDLKVDLILKVDDNFEKRKIVLDHHRFHQVVRNLMENAVDANLSAAKTSDSPSKIMIHVALIAQDLVIEILDEGEGINEKDFDQVFEPFFTTKTKGTGLGLAISRRVIEKHGGCLQLVKSSKGARFQIRLPQKSNSSEGSEND